MDAPTREDLQGAATGIARLQSTYDLKAADFINGYIMNTNFKANLSTNDAYHMGLSLYESKDYRNAHKWFLHVWQNMPKETQDIKQYAPEISARTLLKYMAFAMQKLGTKNCVNFVQNNKLLLFR